MKIDVEQFWRDGYLVLRGVFRPEEVLRWRERALSQCKSGTNYTVGDLLSDDVLQQVILDDRILSSARQILEADPVYFGDSTFAIGYNGWGFHKDNADRVNGNAPDWSVDRYPIIRFGIYTQNHGPNDVGGLELLRGSHLIPDCRSGEHVAPDINIGDLLVWNHRTTHSAGPRKLKLLGLRIPAFNPILAPRRHRLENILMNIEWLAQQPKTKRVAIFCSFARESPLLERNLEYLKQREYPWEAWKNIHWTSQTRSVAQDKGLTLLDVTVFKPDGRERYKDHRELPY